MVTSTHAAAILFEEGSTQPQNLCQENGVRVQGGSDAAQYLENIWGEIRERVTWGTEFGGEGRRSWLGGLWSVAVIEEEK